jgi:ankyrin repeat protein
MNSVLEHKNVYPLARPSCVPGERTKQSELMVACVAGKLGVVRRLLAAGVDPNHVNEFGETPLTYAVAAQAKRVVALLLSRGANIELPATPSWSPLMYAAAVGNFEVLNLLLNKGADPKRQDRDGRTPAVLAKTAGHFRCAALLDLRTSLAQTVEQIQQPSSPPAELSNAERPQPPRQPVPPSDRFFLIQ